MSRIDRLRQQGIDLYPARAYRTHTIKSAKEVTSEAVPVCIAGRLEHIGNDGIPIRIRDESDVIEATVKESLLLSTFSVGDLAECKGYMEDGRLAVADLRLIVPSMRSAPDHISIDILKLRAAVLQLTRRFFDERDFLAVDTPAFMAVPDVTPALASFETTYRDEAGHMQSYYLQTSPEHYMKRLLAGGCERIYQICRFYRNGERYDAHHPEFTGLEWYEAYADYHDVMKTTEEYIASLAVALNGNTILTYQEALIDLSPPWPRQTVREAMLACAHIDLNACQTREAFFQQAHENGYETREDDTWDDLFHRIFLQKVEPAFPSNRPIFLTEYPAQLPSLARQVPDDDRYVERFELYIGGLELANAFTELTDPVEQRRRFEADRLIKQKNEQYDGGVDEALLAALEYGMPPAGGIALGLDRLIMLFADVATIDPVITFRNY